MDAESGSMPLHASTDAVFASAREHCCTIWLSTCQSLCVTTAECLMLQHDSRTVFATALSGA